MGFEKWTYIRSKFSGKVSEEGNTAMTSGSISSFTFEYSQEKTKEKDRNMMKINPLFI
ncbi:MAG: hypothetical protein AAFR87_27910 [Bacteroidota bacterium]